MILVNAVRIGMNAAVSLARVAVDPQLADGTEKARRLAICAACEFRRVQEAKPERAQYDYCGECGCPLDEKAGRIASPCPKSKW